MQAPHPALAEHRPCMHLQHAPLPYVAPRAVAGGAAARRAPVAVRAKGEQKNEGLYFEYEEVDPEASKAAAVEFEQDEEEFGWARASRLTQKQGRQRMDNARPQEKRSAKVPAGKAQAQLPTNKPQRPTSGLAAAARAEPRAVTPEHMLVKPPPRPVQQQPVAPPASQPISRAAKQSASSSTSSPGSSASSGGASQTAAPTSRQAAGPPSTSRPEPRAEQGTDVRSSAAATSGNAQAAGGAAAAPAAPAAAAASSKERRQKLLQRMKGKPASTAPEEGVRGAKAQPQPQPAAAAASSAAGGAAKAGGVRAAGAVATAGGAAAALRAAQQSFAAEDGLRQQLEGLVAQLPSDEALSEDERQAKALLASFLTGSDADGTASAGDMAAALRKEAEALQEYQEWLRDVAAEKKQAGRQQPQQGQGQQRAGAAAAQGNGASVEGSEEDGGIDWGEVERDLDRLAATLGQEFGGAADLFDFSSDDAGEQQGGGSGDVLTDAAAELADIQALIKQMDGMAAQTQGDDDVLELSGSPDGDLTDEQVIELLRKQDPELYEMLRDVPEFDKLDLDFDLDLSNEQLTEEELAELAAEAESGQDRAEVEALLRDMRGMGLVDEDGKPVGAGEDEDDEGDEDEDDVTLGDLFDAIDEDEELDPRERMKAQYALQSMFNSPSDELSAKGKGGKEAVDGADDGAAAAAARGPTSTGGAAAGGDDVPLPPVLPRPRPAPRKSQ